MIESALDWSAISSLATLSGNKEAHDRDMVYPMSSSLLLWECAYIVLVGDN